MGIADFRMGRMRFLNSVMALAAAMSLLGCMHPLKMPAEALIDTNRIFKTLEAQKISRPRLSGRYKAKATGLKQFLGSVDVIFALQQPSSFYISVPSFFGNPARIVASDGRTIYLLDLSTGNPNYTTLPSTSAALDEWLGLKIEPRDFVDALLGVVELEGASLVDAQIIRRNKRYRAKLRYPNQTHATLELDSDTDDLLLVDVSDAHGRLLHQVSYGNYRDIDGQRFPAQIRIYMKSDTQSIELVLLSEELVFDETPFDASTFQIEEP